MTQIERDNLILRFELLMSKYKPPSGKIFENEMLKALDEIIETYHGSNSKYIKDRMISKGSDIVKELRRSIPPKVIKGIKKETDSVYTKIYDSLLNNVITDMIGVAATQDKVLFTDLFNDDRIPKLGHIDRKAIDWALAINRYTEIQGYALEELIANNTAHFMSKLRSLLTQSLIHGWGRDEAYRKVKEITDKQATHISKTTVNTAMQTARDISRDAEFRALEKEVGVEYYIYSACMCSTTCLVCASLDDRKFYMKIDDIPPAVKPRVHFNCRCQLLPVLDSDLETISKDRENFKQWFARQEESFQKDYLGPGRYELYKQGASLDQFADWERGRELGLKEVEQFMKMRTTATIEATPSSKFGVLENPPLWLFHGTPAEFEKFGKVGTRLTSMGYGHYFGYDLEKAKEYGDNIKIVRINREMLLNWNDLSEEDAKTLRDRLVPLIPEEYLAGYAQPQKKYFGKDDWDEAEKFFDLKDKEAEGRYHDRSKPMIDKDKGGVFVRYIDTDRDTIKIEDSQLKYLAQKYDQSIARDLGWVGAMDTSEVVIYDTELVNQSIIEITPEKLAYYRDREQTIYEKLLNSSPEARTQYEQKHIEVVEQLMDKYNLEGEVEISKGAYNGQTNPNMQIYFKTTPDRGGGIVEADQINAMLSEFGKSADQDSVGWYTTKYKKGGENAILFDIKEELTKAEFDEFYLKLIEENGGLGINEKNGRIEIRDYTESLSMEELGDIIDGVLDDTGSLSNKYVHGSDTSFTAGGGAFIEAPDYDKYIDKLADNALYKLTYIQQMPPYDLYEYDPSKAVKDIRAMFKINYSKRDYLEDIRAGRDLGDMPLDYMTITGTNIPKHIEDMADITIDQFEATIQRNKNENLLMITEDGKRYIATGDQTHVDVPPLWPGLMPNGVATHNHPSQVHALSPADIKLMIAKKLKSISAVSGDTIFRLTREDAGSVSTVTNNAVYQGIVDMLEDKTTEWYKWVEEEAKKELIKKGKYKVIGGKNVFKTTDMMDAQADASATKKGGLFYYNLIKKGFKEMEKWQITGFTYEAIPFYREGRR